MSELLVTIGIPCFNAELWIAPAIESALAQKWPSIDVIVVDDGSTDGSLEKIRLFGDRIRVVPGEHRGGNHARNQVIAQARGSWIQFLDADDYLQPEKIATQFSETRNAHDADAIYSPFWIEQSSPSNPAAPLRRWVTEIDESADIFTQWISWQLPQTGAFLWRKAALEALGGWKEGQPCCQEHELYLRALKADLRLAFAPTPHAVYRQWSEDTVCRKDPMQTIRVRTALIDDARGWLSERGRWNRHHYEAAARACFEMARTIARDNLDAAVAYHADRRSVGLIRLDGPAAPSVYRWTYRLVGFANAERLAKVRRPKG